jgi:hypothetical protein
MRLRYGMRTKVGLRWSAMAMEVQTRCRWRRLTRMFGRCRPLLPVATGKGGRMQRWLRVSSASASGFVPGDEQVVRRCA